MAEWKDSPDGAEYQTTTNFSPTMYGPVYVDYEEISGPQSLSRRQDNSTYDVGNDTSMA